MLPKLTDNVEESVLLSKHFLNNPSQYWIWIDMICVVSTALSHDKKIALNSEYSQDCKEFEYRLKYFRLNLNFLVAFLDAFPFRSQTESSLR